MPSIYKPQLQTISYLPVASPSIASSRSCSDESADTAIALYPAALNASAVCSACFTDTQKAIDGLPCASFDELYINVNGESGYFERSLAVYGREGEPCRRTPRCDAEIIRIAFANRSSRLCPGCQTR